MFIISDLLSVLPSSNAGTASPLQIGQALSLEAQGRFKEVLNEVCTFVDTLACTVCRKSIGLGCGANHGLHTPTLVSEFISRSN